MGHFPPTSWLCLFLVVLVHCCRESGSVDFRLVSSKRPLVVMTGEDIVLPCSAEPVVSAEDFTVEWLTLGHGERTNKVHSFRQGQAQNREQIASFRGRTELFRGELRNGNVSLRLRNVQPADNRDYICLTASSLGQHYAIAKLIVRAKGTKPEISSDACDDSGICRLVCSSSGWSPRPTIDWLDGRKRKLTTDAPAVRWEPEGFTVLRRLQVETGSNDTYICRVSVKDHVEQTEIHI